MKIANYIKNSLIDYPGHIASVVFTAGCNWNCWYCLNRSLIDRDIQSQTNEQEFFDFLESRKGWLDGIVICGGEPTLHKDLIEFIKKIKEYGYDVKLDTNGTSPSMLKTLVEEKLIDYVAMDIKAPFSKYNQIVQLKNEKDVQIENVKKSINYLLSNKIPYEFRTTVSPDLSIDDVVEISKEIRGASKYYLQPYKKPTEESPSPKEPKEIEEMQKLCNEFVPTFIR